jgi:ATP-dependent protease HslVU (ClpYQ) ATPase subunit
LDIQYTDVGYVSHDDETLLRDLLKNRIALNQEVLLEHNARQ